MSSDDNHWRGHMTPTAHNICTHAIFATSWFIFQPSNLFCSTLLLRKGIIHCSTEKLKKKTVKQGCLTVVWQMTCPCWCVLIQCFCFASSVCFSSFNFVWLQQGLVSLSFSKTTVHINLFEYFVS